jgi:hypothetical protein
MSDGSDSDDRDAQMLARLAELDLAAAERAHAKLMAAEAPNEVAELGRTYQRMARSLRQTLALKAQLKRDRARPASALSPALRKPPSGTDLGRRMRELRQGVLRVIWDEAETSELADWHSEGLDEIICEDMLSDSFCAGTLDDHVARVCLELGLDAGRTARWRTLPDPPDQVGRRDEAPPPPDSSA